jgi:uncharacterized protein (TIGR02271 family)
VSEYRGRHEISDDAEDASASFGLTRHEDELRVGTRNETVGSVRLRRTVESGHVSDVLPREIEEAEPLRTSPLEDDSGDVVTFPDGSVSVPVFEEELVVTKRLVVRERIVIQKRRVSEDARIEAELLRERVDFDAEPGVVEER